MEQAILSQVYAGIGKVKKGKLEYAILGQVKVGIRLG